MKNVKNKISLFVSILFITSICTISNSNVNQFISGNKAYAATLPINETTSNIVKVTSVGLNKTTDLIKVNAQNLTNSGQTVTVKRNVLTNKTTTIVGQPYTFSSSTAINAATLDEFMAKLKNALSTCEASVTLNYTGSTSLGNLSTVLINAPKLAMNTAGNDYEKNLLYQWNISYTTTGRNDFTVTYNLSYLEDSNKRSQVTSKVKDILSKIITKGMTDEQKEKAINDYICLNVAYDNTLVQHTAYAALFNNKKTVCQGYALLAYRMLTAAGLQARIITGTGNGGAHAWNMVQIKDSKGQNPTWYHLDVTWDDPIPDRVGRIRYDYFNLRDSQMRQKGHTWTAAYYPAANKSYVTTDSQILAGGRIVNVTTSSPVNPVVKVTAVKLNKTTDTLKVGSTDTLNIAVAPVNATNKTVTWTSSNSKVATVTNGVIKAVNKGTVKITATTVDGSKTASCTVVINNQHITPPTLNSIKVTVDAKR